MTREMTTAEKVKIIIIDQLGVNPIDVTPEADLREDLGADSLDIVEIVMVLEEQFNIGINDDDVMDFKTVKSVIDYVVREVGK